MKVKNSITSLVKKAGVPLASLDLPPFYKHKDL